MNCYSRLLADKPLIVLTSVGIFALITLSIPFIAKKIPDFTDPTLGFEARGTILSNRLTAWENLIEATRPSGPLSVNPKELIKPPHKPRKLNKSTKQRKRKKLNKSKHSRHLRDDFVNYTRNFEKDNQNNSNHEHWGFSGNVSYTANEDHEEMVAFRRNQWQSLYNLAAPNITHEHRHYANNGYFCNSPSPEYAHLVISKTNPEISLFTLQSLQTMCKMEQDLILATHYQDLCETIIDGHCCPAWSLPNYVAMIGGKNNCSQIAEIDVNRTLHLLQDCVRFYHNLQLRPDCYETDLCPGIPDRCKQHDTVYNIFHYLLDVNFLPPNNYNIGNLDNVMLFVPLASSSAALPFYQSLPKLKIDGIYISAMDMGIKNTLFEEYLLEDTWLIGLGALSVLSCMLLYTGTLFLTCMTLTAILFSLGVAYFSYTMIFDLNFFPFMNLLAIVIAVGIGADDAFILIKVWQSERLEIVPKHSFLDDNRPNNIGGMMNRKIMRPLMQRILKHASPCIFVSSLTTGAALYSSYFSNISAVRCFGIFSGTAVLANYLFMMSWMPAAISSLELFNRKFSASIKIIQSCDQFQKRLNFKLYQLGQCFENVVIEAVIRFKYLWILILGILAIASAFIVLYKPQLKLPDTQDFQLFDSSHPFEQYDLIYRDKFWFERFMRNGSDSKFPMRFVWGILPEDTGNYLDPTSRGSLIFDENFNISHPESQKWLLQFCRKLRGQDFYQSTIGPLLPNCFIENFITWMNRRCIDVFSKKDRSPCCEISSFPFESKVFDHCLIEAIGDLYETPREYFMPGVAGPKFSKTVENDTMNNTTIRNVQDSIVKAIVIEYDSNVVFSLSYEMVKDFYTKVDNWTKHQIENAPGPMKGGWFISHLNFFDLQETLSIGTIIAIGLSMGIALVILLLVTLNILLSLFAILTVSCVIFVTVAILILLGWKLNVLESIAVSTAIGLAVDFSLHYSIHYKMAPQSGVCYRENSTRYSLKRMCGPTAMAALTTFFVGAFMLPSRVLAYIQIGVFLVVIMTVSWIYSTFFLGSLFYAIGPQYGFWQFSYKQIYHFLYKCKLCHCIRTTFNECLQRKSKEFTEISQNANRESNVCNSNDAADNMQPKKLNKKFFQIPKVKFTNSSSKAYSNDLSPSSAISIIMCDEIVNGNTTND